MIGFMPNLFECGKCGILFDQCATLYFDVSLGGIVCSKCNGESPGCYSITSNTLYTMQHIVSVPIDELYQFTVSDRILTELNKIMNTYISYYIDKQFKTLAFI